MTAIKSSFGAAAAKPPSGWVGAGLLVLGAALISFGVQLALFLAVSSRGRPAMNLYRDPNIIAGQPLSSGLLSGAGALVMAGAAAVGLFTYVASSRSARHRLRYLLWAGVFTAFLAADDLLMFHDGFLPRLGISQTVSQASYGLLALAWLISYRREILAGDRQALLWLVAALGALGLSVGLDLVTDAATTAWLVGYLEENAKLTGFVFLASFFVRAGWVALREQQSSTIVESVTSINAGALRAARLG